MHDTHFRETRLCTLKLERPDKRVLILYNITFPTSSVVLLKEFAVVAVQSPEIPSDL